MPLTVGVEEEFHLVDPGSRRSTAAAEQVLAALGRQDAVVPELKASVVETNSEVCTDLGVLHRDLARLRRELAAAAGSAGVAIVGAGSVPLPGTTAAKTYPKDRYARMSELFAITAHQQLVCGVQTQVGIPDRDLAARVLTRALPWAPVMAALAAGSPYWDETDTQFASYRTQVWDRWPSAGVTAGFESAAEYDAVVAALLESETIVDVGMVYFDIRLSAHQPTVEFRVCDSTPRIELVVALAGLWRALAATCIEELTSGRSALRPRVELLRAARWKASRFGLSADLLDPVNGAPAPAADVVAGLLDHVMPALRAAGDDGIVREEVDRTLREQGCAQRQRRAAAGGGGLVGVVDDLMSQTSPH